MIKSIALYNLRNGEYSQLMQDVLKITRENDPAMMKVQVLFTALESIAGEIESIFKIPTGSVITTELEKLDLQRDNAMRGINGIINANTYSDDPIIKSHADILEKHLALFGNVANDSYQSETSSIRNIIADWDGKPELKAALAALNLNSWRVSLENANNSFTEYYLLRAKEQGFNVTESLKEKRLKANDAYYALRDTLNAYYVIENGAEPYKSVVAYINGLLDNYNSLLTRRKGGDAEEAGGGDTPPTEGQG
jgi:hypothetical protein